MSNATKAVEKKGPVAWMAGHSVASNLVMLLFIVGGYLMLGHVKKEVFPNFSIDIVTVSVPYPGASPEEVEKGIVLPVEEAISGLEFVDLVKSTANEGVGVVAIELVDGTEVQIVARVNEVKAVADLIRVGPHAADVDVFVRHECLQRCVSLATLVGEVELFQPRHKAVLQFGGKLVSEAFVRDFLDTG